MITAEQIKEAKKILLIEYLNKDLSEFNSLDELIEWEEEYDSLVEFEGRDKRLYLWYLDYDCDIFMDIETLKVFDPQYNEEDRKLEEKLFL